MIFARTAATKMVPRVTARYNSTATMLAAKKPNVWLADPSTYPLIAIMGAAVAGCTGFMAYKLVSDKALCISGKYKGKTLRD